MMRGLFLYINYLNWIFVSHRRIPSIAYELTVGETCVILRGLWRQDVNPSWCIGAWNPVGWSVTKCVTTLARRAALSTARNRSWTTEICVLKFQCSVTIHNCNTTKVDTFEFCSAAIYDVVCAFKPRCIYPSLLTAYDCVVLLWFKWVCFCVFLLQVYHVGGVRVANGLVV